MDSKLESGGKGDKESPSATYKPIPEADVEDEAIASRPKSLFKAKSSPVGDGAEEKMLPEADNKIVIEMEKGEKTSPNGKQNGEAKLDIGEVKAAFVGLTKEELMKYANDPFWVRLRWFLFIGFWVLWAAMLLGAVFIIYAAPKCDPPPPRTWWEMGPLTELPPDSDIDNLKLDKHITGLIVSYQEDPYDSVIPENVIKIITKSKELGTNVILEVDPTFSDIYFGQSEQKLENFTDYYIWQPPQSTPGIVDSLLPPNNWLNKNNVSSWKYSDKRKQYYYAPFDRPHLNFRNERVVQEFSKTIERLIKLGAAGISLKNAAFLLVEDKFENEPPNPLANAFDHTQYGFYSHTKTENLPELGQLLKEFKRIVNNKTTDGLLMVSDELKEVEPYKVNGKLIVDLPVQAHIFSKPKISVNDTVNTLNYVLNISNVEWPLWKANSTAVPRDALDIVTYLLPGATLIPANVTVDTHLLKIREGSPSVMRGTCSPHSLANHTVLAIVRQTPGSPGILVALNPSEERISVNLKKEISSLRFVEEVTILHYSKGYNETDYLDINSKKDSTFVPISAKSALVLSYVPKEAES